MKFASICRKSGKIAMSESTLLSLLRDDSSFNQSNPISLKYPQVGVIARLSAYMYANTPNGINVLVMKSSPGPQSGYHYNGFSSWITGALFAFYY